MLKVGFALQMHSALLTFDTVSDFLRGFAGSHAELGCRVWSVHYPASVSVLVVFAKHAVAGARRNCGNPREIDQPLRGLYGKSAEV